MLNRLLPFMQYFILKMKYQSWLQLFSLMFSSVLGLKRQHKALKGQNTPAMGAAHRTN